MALTADRIGELILDQLSRREMRLLSLVVAIRKGLAVSEGMKGDLSAGVKSALRRLVAAGTVIDEEGLYALPSPCELAGSGGDIR